MYWRAALAALVGLVMAPGSDAQRGGAGGGRGGGRGGGFPGRRGRGRRGSRAPSGAISAKAGLVVAARGDVDLDGTRVTRELLTEFPHVEPGKRLEVRRGRAEVLMAPARRLYVNGGTTFGMVNDSLDDAEIEIVRGSLILDVFDTLKEQTVGVAFAGARFVVLKKGRYRFEVDGDGRAVMKVFSGAARAEGADVSRAVPKRGMATATGDPAAVEFGKFAKSEKDGFDEFVDRRSEQILMAEARRREQEARRRGMPTLDRRGGIGDASNRGPGRGGGP